MLVQAGDGLQLLLQIGAEGRRRVGVLSGERAYAALKCGAPLLEIQGGAWALVPRF